MNRILGIVPARGGSKGIYRKNLSELGGKPLLEWTASTALASNLKKVVLSTDDAEIAAVGEHLGLEVPGLRPGHLAGDQTRTIDVVQYVLHQDREEFDAVMVLQPTSPFRGLRHINQAIQFLETDPCDSVISLVEVTDAHPQRMKTIKAGFISDPEFAEKSQGLPRQLLPKFYLRNGAIYLSRIEIIEAKKLQGSWCRGLIMDRFSSMNIDDPFDLEVARCLVGSLA